MLIWNIAKFFIVCMRVHVHVCVFFYNWLFPAQVFTEQKELLIRFKCHWWHSSNYFDTFVNSSDRRRQPSWQVLLYQMLDHGSKITRIVQTVPLSLMWLSFSVCTNVKIGCNVNKQTNVGIQCTRFKRWS